MSHACDAPPSIRTYDSDASRNGRTPSSFSSSCCSLSHSSTPACPMPIPRARETPPPPLPPPCYISALDNDTGRDHSTQHPQSPSWQVRSPRYDAGFASKHGSIRSGTSSFNALHAQKKSPDSSIDRFTATASPRQSSILSIPNVDTDMNDPFDVSDDKHATSTISRRFSGVSRRLHSESQLGQRSLENSSHAYDRQLLAKMGDPQSGNTGGNASVRPPTGFLSPTLLDPSLSTAVPSPREKFDCRLKPLVMPERRYESLDSPTDSPTTRRLSALTSSRSPSITSFRSQVDSSNSGTMIWKRRNSTSASAFDPYEDSRPLRGREDQAVFVADHDLTIGNSGMRNLNLGERSPGALDEFHGGTGASLKRRAPSPPTESLRRDRVWSGHDLYHRRSTQTLQNLASPLASPFSSRFNPAQGSVSSPSSLGPKTGSFVSNKSWGHSVASSVTSYGERTSPSALSPAVDVDTGPMSPHAASRSLMNPSPRSSVTKEPPHQRTFSESEPSHGGKMSTDINASHSRQNSVSHHPGLYTCECCPKKPKKFGSMQELRAHQQEKQYQCQYCSNRFKNKNEAERHQKSLHLRRHSWSCALLMGVQSAFLSSGAPSVANDLCGYCGQEFPNPPNWEERTKHLNQVHKFVECNKQKKFFRADHFRQHLKHSHAGMAGKWTSLLENACMKDEPPPQVPPPVRAARAGG